MSTTAQQKRILKDAARRRREAEIAAGIRHRPVVFTDRKKVANKQACRGRATD